MAKMHDDVRKLLQQFRGPGNRAEEEALLLSMFNLMNPFSVGWARWHDTATQSTPLSLTADEWTKVPNDGLGTKSRATQYLPSGVRSLFNTSTGQFDYSDLGVGSFIFWDYSITADVSTLNTILDVRADYAIGSDENFQVALDGPDQVLATGERLMGGFGVACLCAEDTVNSPTELQIRADRSGTDITVNFFHAVVFAV